MSISVLSIIICFVLLSTSCREDERIIPSTPYQVTPGVNGTSVKGFFLLNEGNMGSNKCTLDFMTALPVSIIVIFMPSGIRP